MTTDEQSRSEKALPVEQESQKSEWQSDLIGRCLKGDESAFALIADQYGSLLLRTTYLLVRDEESAKDIVQETLILAWKKLHTLRDPTLLRAWLLKIAVNQSMSFKRQLARQVAFLHEQIAQRNIDTAIQEADSQRGTFEDTLDIEKAIEKLPLNQRAILVLFYYQKMSMSEIAAMLNISENTLRKRLQAALEKIRRVLQSETLYARENLMASEDMHAHIKFRSGEV